MPESAARYIAPTGAAWVETRRAWAEAARGWRGAASALPDDLQDAGLIRHPRVGPITAAGAARFSAAHTVHHHAQLDRVRDAHGFPA